MLRHLPPFIVRRQSPTVSQYLTCAPRRLPRVETAIKAAIPFRTLVAIGRHSVDVQIARCPLLSVRHPPGRNRAGWSPVLRKKAMQRAVNKPERDAQRVEYSRSPNRPCLVVKNTHERPPRGPDYSSLDACRESPAAKPARRIRPVRPEDLGIRRPGSCPRCSGMPCATAPAALVGRAPDNRARCS